MKLKIYLKKKRSAFLTIQSVTKEDVENVLLSLQNEKPFLKIANVILRKDEIKYVKLYQKRKKKN